MTQALPRAPGCAGVEREQILGRERGDAPGIRFEVVEQVDAGQAQLRRHRRGVDEPGQVRRLHAAVAHGAGDAEARMAGGDRMGGDELADDLAQAGVLAARVGLLDDRAQATVLELEGGESRGGAARVSGQNHCAIFRESRAPAQAACARRRRRALHASACAARGSGTFAATTPARSPRVRR